MLNLPLYPIPSATQQLASAAASVTITLSDYSLPSWATHLVVLVNAASADATAERALEWTFNGAATLFNDQNVKGSSTTASAARADSQTAITCGEIPGSSVHASAFGGGVFLIPDYADTNRHRMVMGIAGAAENSVSMAVGRWGAATALASIVIAPSSGNFLAGSTFTLCAVDERYRVTVSELSGSDGTFDLQNIPSVSGGYGDLVAIACLRSDLASTIDNVNQALNNDTTAANYNEQTFRGDNTSAAGQRNTSNREVINTACPGDNATASVFSVTVSEINAYALGANDPTHHIVSGNHESSTPRGRIWIASTRRNNIEALTRFALSPSTGTNFKDGSGIWLYYVPRGFGNPVKRTIVGSGGSASVTVDVSDLTGNMLVINIYGAGEVAAATDDVDIELNSDTTASNYEVQDLTCVSSTITAARSSGGQQTIGVVPAASAANEFGKLTAAIFGHTETDRHKHILVEEGRSDTGLGIHSMRWISTAAVTQVKLTPQNGDFAEGSVIEVFAVPAAGFDTVTRKQATVLTS